MITAFATGLAIGSWVIWIIMRIVVSNMQKQIKLNHETIEYLMASNVKARMDNIAIILDGALRMCKLSVEAANAIRQASRMVYPSSN